MSKRKLSTFERLSQGKMNRKQRQELARRLYSDDPGLEVVHRNVAGIDVGNESHFVAVAPGCDSPAVREFGSWTADLMRMAEWLKSCGVKMVVMQSTGVYWIAVYEVLEKAGFQVWLTNARDTKNLPGRKSDVQESQWLLKLQTYGLLRNSFRPPEEIRRLRTVWGLRNRHVQEAGRAIQHMQKALTTMNVQLANTLSDVSGVSGQAIIRARRLKDLGLVDMLHPSNLSPEAISAWLEAKADRRPAAEEVMDFSGVRRLRGLLEEVLAAPSPGGEATHAVG